MIHLAYPYVPTEARVSVLDTLSTRWIGQGPKVKEFEQKFQSQLKTKPAIAVGAGTDALHLAYLMANVQPGDEVITPVFTCTATNMPLLWMGAKIVFADIQPDTLNIDPKDVERKITNKTKAIVGVDYAGQPCDWDELRRLADQYHLTLIDDAAHAVGATYRGQAIGDIADLTCFSFQAIKHITTGDGGMLTTSDPDRAALLRWFGIDRENKFRHMHHWEGDISVVGYKYQMTDIAASMGLVGLDKLQAQLAHREKLIGLYYQGLRGIEGINLLEFKTERKSAFWLMTVLADNRDGLQAHLIDREIESSPFHYRNDKYTIFQDFRGEFPNMDLVDSRILCLPLHMHLTEDDVRYVVDSIKTFYAHR